MISWAYCLEGVSRQRQHQERTRESPVVSSGEKTKVGGQEATVAREGPNRIPGSRELEREKRERELDPWRISLSFRQSTDQTSLSRNYWKPGKELPKRSRGNTPVSCQEACHSLFAPVRMGTLGFHKVSSGGFGRASPQ